MFNNKRGQGMPMNTVIIGILVLIVLIVIIAFFTGGAGTVIDKVKSIFGMATKAQDYTMAVKSCEEYCTQAKDLQASTNPNTVVGSAYCTSWFKLDVIVPKDGNLDKDQKGEPIHYYCGSVHSLQDSATTSTLNIPCAGVVC